MKRPFTQYALLGSGRVARHLHYYLESLNLPVALWSRNGDPKFNTHSEIAPAERLARTILPASHILIAVSDQALPQFAGIGGETRTHVHFSGTANVEGIEPAHPLMTFGENLETLDWYRKIPFIIEEGRTFSEILPGLPNPHYSLPREQRPLYHALCSLAGNSTFLLWKQIGDEFETTLGLPRSLLSPFLHQVVANSSKYSETNFTGPVARGDWGTVKKHLETLNEKPGLRRAYERYLGLADDAGFDVPEALV